MAAGHSIFAVVGVPESWEYVAGSATVVAGLTGLGLIVRSKLSNVDAYAVPDGKVSVANISIGIVQWLRSLFKDILGEGFDSFTPFLGTIFLFLLGCNLLGVIPMGVSSTADISANAGLAVVVFIIYHFLGIREHGFHYAAQFTGGLPKRGYGAAMYLILAAIALLLLFIETVGHAFRPLTLSFRLWGNVNGDHTLVAVFNQLAPIGVPIVFMAFGVLVSFIQAFVFTLLSTVYIKLAVSHDH